jgi:dTDP-4-dehydrorhamnose reductase
MMRIAVTGSIGQVATSLIEQAGRAFDGRRVFLLEDRAAVLAGLNAARPDLVINAFYTAVDQAEAEESLAVAINGEEGVHRPRNWRLPLLSTAFRGGKPVRAVLLFGSKLQVKL